MGAYRSCFRVIDTADRYVANVQCMGCRSTFQICLFENYGDTPGQYVDYNKPLAFCPVCGGYFDNKLDARPHYMPRWTWDRYRVNNEVPRRIFKPGKYDTRHAGTGYNTWIIEIRSRMLDTDTNTWGDWGHWRPEYSAIFERREYIARLLQQYKKSEESQLGWFQSQYRARIDKTARVVVPIP